MRDIKGVQIEWLFPWIVSFLLIIVLGQSILIIRPLIRRKFGSHIRLLASHNSTEINGMVVKAAKRMLLSRNVYMSFNDDESFYYLLARIKNRISKNYTYHAYSYYNFPLAFLLIGLIDQHVAFTDHSLLDSVKRKCRDILDETGKPKFLIDKVDQAVFGLLFLRLFEVTRKDYYLVGAQCIYRELLNFKRDDGLYRYRREIDVFFIDTVGLLCPFLVKYAEITGTKMAMKDAERQVEFALSHCVEPRHGLAFHAFDLIQGQPLGSVNWSRGMGWLLLGLSAVARVHINPSLENALHRYKNVLECLRGPSGYWPQFLGHTNDEQIDSSGTLMFLYAFQQFDVLQFNDDEMKKLACQCIDEKGRVVHCSGDTIYINKYSRVKGPSELSQGLMLSLIARAKR